MISTVLVEHPWMSPLALAVLVVAGPPASRLLTARPRLAWTFAGLALVPVALLTLVPVDRVLFERCSVHWAWPTPARVELMANVVLFVAPVLLAAVAVRRALVAVLAGIALSAAIEVLQALVPAIGRSCDTSDWLCNSIGAVIGGLLAWPALRRGS